MTASPTSEKYTPEQRRLLGQAYRMILGWGMRTYLNHFTQPDSIVPDPYNSQDYDRYSYARNNPLRYTDPSGHLSEDEIMETFGAKTWKEVIKLFEKDGKYEGQWGWLELLRFAQSGDEIFSANGEMVGARYMLTRTDLGELVFRDGQYLVQTESGFLTIGELIDSTSSEHIGLTSTSGAELALQTERQYNKPRFNDWNEIDKVDLGVDTFGVVGDIALLVPGYGGIVWGASEVAEVLTMGKSWDDLEMGNPSGVLIDTGATVLESSKLVPGAGFYGNLVSIANNVFKYSP